MLFYIKNAKVYKGSELVATNWQYTVQADTTDFAYKFAVQRAKEVFKLPQYSRVKVIGDMYGIPD